MADGTQIPCFYTCNIGDKYKCRSFIYSSVTRCRRWSVELATGGCLFFALLRHNHSCSGSVTIPLEPLLLLNKILLKDWTRSSIVFLKINWNVFLFRSNIDAKGKKNNICISSYDSWLSITPPFPLQNTTTVTPAKTMSGIHQICVFIHKEWLTKLFVSTCKPITFLKLSSLS